MNKTIGDVRLLDDSKSDVGSYLDSVDLTDEERKEVAEQFVALKPSVQRPFDSPVPVIVDGWLG